MTDYGEKASYKNKEILLKSTDCGCFSCATIFPSSAIKRWIDNGETAMCPFCGVDAVLGDATETVTLARLKELKEYWFGDVDPLP